MKKTLGDLLKDVKKSIINEVDKKDPVVSLDKNNDGLVVTKSSGEKFTIDLSHFNADMEGIAKGEKGDTGERGERGFTVKGDRGEPGRAGNSITDVRFDQRGHLIIETDDKTYDLGLLRSGGGTTTIVQQGNGSGSDLDLTENYIFVGNAQGKAEESADLIDINLDLIEVNDRLDELQGSTPLLKESSNAFPAAQVISDMQSGFLFHANAGNLISLSVLTNDHLPGLAEGHIRVGNSSGRPSQVPYELNTIPVNGDIDLNGFKVTNSATPLNGSDLANKDYVDSVAGSGSGTITLEGAVTGSGTGTITTTLADINTSQIMDFDSSVKSYQLDDFQAPTSTLDVGNQLLSNVSTPVIVTDAATKGYVDTAVSGAVDNLSVEGFVVGGSPVGGVITTNRGSSCLLTNIPAGGDVNMDNNKITSLANPTNSQDAANKFYVDSVAGGSGGSTTLTGAVTGSGTGTINTTLTPITTSQITNFNTSVNSSIENELNDQPAGCVIVNDFPNNLNTVAGQNIPTSFLPYSLAPSSKWFDMPIPGRLRALHPNNYDYQFVTVLEILITISSFGNSDLTFEFVKNSTVNIIKPRFTTTAQVGITTSFVITSEPINLGQNDYVELYVEASINNPFTKIRNLTTYARKF